MRILAHRRGDKSWTGNAAGSAPSRIQARVHSVKPSLKPKPEPPNLEPRRCAWFPNVPPLLNLQADGSSVVKLGDMAASVHDRLSFRSPTKLDAKLSER